MYRKTNNPNCVQRISDGVLIPLSDAYEAHAEYQTWLAEGNTLADEAPTRKSLEDRIAALEEQLKAR